jgi:S1-C subfamily serine protease
MHHAPYPDNFMDIPEPETPLRTWPYWLTAALVAGGAIGGALLWSEPAQGVALVGPTVKVIYHSDLGARGHGSGVHIGNGFILTAAHVVDKKDMDFDIKFDDQGVAEDVEVMWINTKYDIALLRIVDSTGVESRDLNCVDPAIGDPITVEGNPLGFEFVTSYGHVGSTVQTVYWPIFSENVAWQAAYAIDADASPGNSGGPVYDANGDIVGIVVGRAPGEALRWAVPASTVCNLLGQV